MNSKLTPAALLAASLLAVACGDTSGAEDESDAGGLNITETDGDQDDGDSDSQSDSDSADSDSDSDGGNDSFPDTGDGNDSDGVAPTCGSERILLSSSSPNVMLLLDKSGSMTSNSWDHDDDDSTDEVRRWTSLHDVTAELLTTYGDTVNFGAVLFPALDAEVLDTQDYDRFFDAACKMADSAEVPVAAGNHDAILSAIPERLEEFEGATPTREAVLNGLEHLENLSADGPRAMVLVTDGAANCVYEPGTNLGRVYDTELELAVQSAYEDHGIPTYVVGIDIGADHPVDGRNLTDDLNAVAKVGGVARDGDEQFYNVADQDTLAAALDEIARRVECTVELESSPVDPDAVDVEIDGESVPQLATCSDGDGWRYTSDAHTAIELCNAACVDFREVQQLDTTYTCPPAG